jgi:bacterioferritin-associated ferredoxin
MYVCVCLAVTQSQVEEAIVGGATTREAVTRTCGAGGDCGACHGMIATMLEDHMEAGAPPLACCPAAADSSERLVPEAALVRTTRAA